ncbi:MAG: type IV secretory system conjugative DNA transfer family protein, partial [Clostridia bacterium]|nr:type IV secretory system conjugative DNA transfer family protein [Clostridia bacterium]
TRASYMSIVYEKLTMFNDAGICAFTSSSDFSSEQLANKPTALFLKIPDEKDTRHNLAAIFILNIYKTLIKVASATEELTLDRNVYFIMDEFGNMPKIEKFDKFITVGRSRKIWFTMIVQSYAQLNNVYGETVADIVKGNCGIKMFIGSNDMNTCKEYSELCGNITVVTSSQSGSIHSDDINLSTQTQVRPLIYPSDLQRLNKPGDIGHSIIVTFGNYPLKTYFSPSFKVSFYKIGKMDTTELSERFFDENEVFYSADKRNKIVFGEEEAETETKKTEESSETETDTETDADAEIDLEKEAGLIDVEAFEREERDKLLQEFETFKEGMPDGTLQDFFKYIVNKMKEDESDESDEIDE